jgi:hypothetical protein
VDVPVGGAEMSEKTDYSTKNQNTYIKDINNIMLKADDLSSYDNLQLDLDDGYAGLEKAIAVGGLEQGLSGRMPGERSQSQWQISVG